MSGIIIAAFFLTQAASVTPNVTVEDVKYASLEWRICTGNAARRRALASIEPAPTIVEAALRDCEEKFQSLRRIVLSGTRGTYPDPNNPDPWLKMEKDAWQARLTSGVPNIRNAQSRCSKNPAERICERLLAP